MPSDRVLQPVAELDWKALLELAEGLAGRHSAATSLRIDGEWIEIRSETRGIVRQRLASSRQTGVRGGRVSRMKSFVTGRRTRAANGEGAFVPALLTYIEQECLVELVGSDAGQLGELRNTLRRHAPWHRFHIRGDEEAIGEMADIRILLGKSAGGETSSGAARAAGLTISVAPRFEPACLLR